MFVLVKPLLHNRKRQERLNKVINNAVKKQIKEEPLVVISTAEELSEAGIKGEKIIFAVCLDENGTNLEYYRMLRVLRSNKSFLEGATGVIVVDGSSELYTKNVAKQLAFAANMCGCSFPGKPLVEATGSLYNFTTLSRLMELSLEDTYMVQVEKLVHKLIKFNYPLQAYKEEGRKKEVLMVHAGSRKTSNSLCLWEMVKSKFGDNCNVTEISLRNGKLMDCRGCQYEDCLHYGERGSCFYGGIIVEQVYPAMLKCDALVIICPNYNDSVGANILAFINRLTAIFRCNDFSNKEIFAVVVSGYSGGDIVAEQILNSMTFNKNMILPPKFAIIETANDAGSILEVENIRERATDFAGKISDNNID